MGFAPVWLGSPFRGLGRLEHRLRLRLTLRLGLRLTHRLRLRLELLSQLVIQQPWERLQQLDPERGLEGRVQWLI